MKNIKKIPTLLLALLLSSCSFLTPIGGFSSSNSDDSSIESNNDSSSSKDVSSSSEKESNESSSEPVSSSEESFSDKNDNDKDVSLEGDKLLLGKYGDCVEFVNKKSSSQSLLDEYNSLHVKRTFEKHGNLQAFYKIGLLELFDINNKVSIQINISNEELQKLDNDHRYNNKETYRICSVDITLKNLHFHYEGVGIRQKGNLSRGEILTNGKINLRHYKLSFEETFDDEFTSTPMSWDDAEAKAYRQDRKFFGLSKLDLRWNRNMDKSYIGEYYAQAMYRANGCLSARSNLMNVKMKVGNNAVQNMGVYLGVETLAKAYIKRNYVKSHQGGNLYKLSWGSGKAATFDESDDYLIGIEEQIKNSETSFSQKSYTYDLKTNKDEADHTYLKNFIEDLKDQHGNTIKTFMSERADYDQFISFIACSYLLGDPDDLRGNGNNGYCYFNSDGQISFIPIDSDRVLGITGGGGNPTGHHGAKSLPFDKQTGYSYNSTKLFNVTLFSSNSKEIPNDYLDKIQSIIDSGWMSFSNYKKYYDVAYRNYSDCLVLGSDINGEKIDFDINDGTTDFREDRNIKLSLYFDTKVSTFSNSKTYR